MLDRCREEIFDVRLAIDYSRQEQVGEYRVLVFVRSACLLWVIVTYEMKSPEQGSNVHLTRNTPATINRGLGVAACVFAAPGRRFACPAHSPRVRARLSAS